MILHTHIHTHTFSLFRPAFIVCLLFYLHCIYSNWGLPHHSHWLHKRRARKWQIQKQLVIGHNDTINHWPFWAKEAQKAFLSPTAPLLRVSHTEHHTWSLITVRAYDRGAWLPLPFFGQFWNIHALFYIPCNDYTYFGLVLAGSKCMCLRLFITLVPCASFIDSTAAALIREVDGSAAAILHANRMRALNPSDCRLSRGLAIIWDRQCDNNAADVVVNMQKPDAAPKLTPSMEKACTPQGGVCLSLDVFLFRVH